MMNLFSRRRAPGRAAAVKGWVAARLSLGDDDLVTLAELACREPGCPPVETVITVLPAAGGRTVARIHKPLDAVTEADVAAVFQDVG